MLRYFVCPVFVVLLNTQWAWAAYLYSIERNSDELVVFDTSSGSIDVVGPIGFDMRSTQLTMHNGLLYGLTGNADGFDSTAFALVGIDPATGSMVSNANVTFDGQNLLVADGLESVDGRLVIAFRHPSLGKGATSGCLGDVSLTGMITGVDDFASFNPDFDGLALSPSGQLFSADGFPDQQFFEVRTVSRSPSPMAYDLFGSYRGGTAAAPFNAADMAFTSSDLFVLNQERHEIHRIDPSSGTLVQTIAYPDDIVLAGLHEAVPEPSSFVMVCVFGVIITAAISCRRPRKLA